jgi:hypothetical protein
MDTLSAAYHRQPVRLEILVRLRKALAGQEDARIYLLEVLKFIMTLGLITATDVLLLMAG